MCLFPKKITTPFNRISRTGGQPLYIEVPCNNCAECKQTARLQWHFRTYYEADACVKSGGYILYDTLTYSDKYLPKLSHFVDISQSNISDFSCFNHKHFKDFLKRLRSRISYTHKGVTFKYFLTSEYGTDERFTHRPHYHILLFVYPSGITSIHPYTLSEYISKSWIYGITDGLPYQPVQYVSDHVFGSNEVMTCNTDYLKVCSYVSKYITKDSTFQSEIDKRISSLSALCKCDDELKSLKRNISMFHRQSHSFGLSYLEELTTGEYNYIFLTGQCRMKDKEKVTLKIPLPLYYKRKLFYKLCKLDDKYCWIPTQQGLQYLENKMFVNIKLQETRIKEKLSNLPLSTQNKITNLLADRTLTDLAIYNLYYRYHSRDLLFIDHDIKTYPRLTKQLTNVEKDLYTWMSNILNTKMININHSDSYYRRDRELDKIYIDSYTDILDFQPKNYNYYALTPKLVFNQDSCRAFRHFDYINHLLIINDSETNNHKQNYYDYTENMKKRYKLLSQLL